jgi:hypothetical protein
MDAQRQSIINSIFKNGMDIGKAVSDRKCNYNNEHDANKTSIISLHGEIIFMFP